MTELEAPPIPQSTEGERKVALGVWAIFITQFVSFLFINARNIATPQIVAEFDGMALFSWLIARDYTFSRNN